MSSTIEIIIVSYDSADSLSTCLRSIHQLAPATPVAIREHSDDPGAWERIQSVAARFPLAIRLEWDPANPGFGAGCNALAESSRARWFMLLNPDTELMFWPYDHRLPSSSAIVGATITNASHVGAHAGMDYRIRHEIARSWLRWRGRAPHGRGFVSGAAMLVDAQTYRNLGGFDERYFMFYEDIDLCMRAVRADVNVSVSADWMVRHEGGHSTSQRLGQALMWSYESACLFHSSQGSPLLAYRAYVAADASIRSLLHAVRRDRDRRTAYASLLRRVAKDVRKRSPATPTEGSSRTDGG